MVPRAEAAAELLSENGIEARVVDMRWVKPLDVDEIARAAQTKLVVTVEGGIISGGVGEGVLNELARQGAAVPALTLGIPDTFVPQGSSNQLLHDLGLDAVSYTHLDVYKRQGLAFPSIVAAGANGASPHAIPGQTVLEAGQCLSLIHIFACLFGTRVTVLSSSSTWGVRNGSRNPIRSFGGLILARISR